MTQLDDMRENLQLALKKLQQVTGERDTLIDTMNKLSAEVTFRNKVTAAQLAVSVKNAGNTDDLITLADRIHTFITS